MIEEEEPTIFNQLREALELVQSEFPRAKDESLKQYLSQTDINQQFIETVFNVGNSDGDKKIPAHWVDIFAEVTLRLNQYAPKGTLKKIFTQYGFDIVEKRTPAKPYETKAKRKKSKSDEINDKKLIEGILGIKNASYTIPPLTNIC
jgi:hypothetical protein